MGQAVYRKYRPQTFTEVVNQEHVKTVLLNEIKHQRIAQAYLFSGPRGIGKTTIARLFAYAVNEAAIKKHQLNTKHLIDIIEIDAASHTGVDNVRENIIQNAYAAPVQLDYKVFIIDEVHMLSASAFNALLKILEEPPAHVIFILATTEIHKLPATVISRCQRFDFHAIKLPDMIKRLQYICEQEQIAVDVAILERIARRAGGAIRDAETMLGQIFSLGEATITSEQADMILPRSDMTVIINILQHLVQKDTKKYLETIHTAAEEGIDMMELHTSLLLLLRQSLLYCVDQSLEHLAALDIHQDTHQELLTILKDLSQADCVALIDLYLEAGTKFAHTSIAQLPLEVAGVRWCNQIAQALPIQIQPEQPSMPIVTSQPTPIAQSRPVAKKSTSQPMEIQSQHSQQAAAAGTSNVTALKAIQDHWKDIVKTIKGSNRSLAMSLSLAQIVDVKEPNILQLGIRYDFHKVRLSNAENQQVLIDTIQAASGESIRIECLVGNEYAVDETILNTLPSDNIASVEKIDNVWDLALNTLGGEEVK